MSVKDKPISLVRASQITVDRRHDDQLQLEVAKVCLRLTYSASVSDLAARDSQIDLMHESILMAKAEIMEHLYGDVQRRIDELYRCSMIGSADCVANVRDGLRELSYQLYAAQRGDE